jgi:hypothetical protein
MVHGGRKYAFNSPKYVFMKLLKCHRLSKITGRFRQPTNESSPVTPCPPPYQRIASSSRSSGPDANREFLRNTVLTAPTPQDGEHEPQLPRATIDVQHEVPSGKKKSPIALLTEASPAGEEAEVVPLLSDYERARRWRCRRRIRSQSTCRGRYEAYTAMTAGQRRSCSWRPSRSTNGDASPPNARPLASSRRRCSSSSGRRRFGISELCFLFIYFE